MQQMIWAVLISFLAVMVMAPIGIPLLKKLKYGQTIYELGPQSHLAKQGVAHDGRRDDSDSGDDSGAGADVGRLALGLCAVRYAVGIAATAQ